MSDGSQLLAAALEYATRGWPVLPLHTPTEEGCSCGRAGCASPGKHPRTAHGVKDATTDEKAIREWWRRWPEANIGLATGAVSGLLVLDVDGDQGRASLRGRDLPETPCSQTGRGWQYLFSCDEAHLVGTAKFAPGLDARAEDQYVVAPPSLHANGNRYAWLIDPADCALADPPAWFRECLTDKDERMNALPGNPEGWVARALAGVEKGRRNDTATKLAGHYVGKRLGVGEVERILLDWNQRNRPPLADDEVRAVVESVARTDARNREARERAAARPRQQGDLPKVRGELLKRIAVLHHTDAGNAEAFALLYGDRVRHDCRRGDWLVWSGHYWRRDATDEVSRLALECVRIRQVAAAHLSGDEKRRKAAKWALDSESERRRDDLLETARILRPIVDAGDSWDSDAWLLGCENGVLDLRTGELRPGRPEDRITMSVGYDFDPEAQAPRWRRFLEEVQPDDDTRVLLQTGVGYSLTGSISEQVFFVHVGAGGNGKTTQTEALRNALGDYAAVTSAATFEQPRGGQDRIPNDVAALCGKRFVSVSEIRQGFRLYEGRVKALTGGDKIPARFLHREWFEFVPVLKLWFAVNSLPAVADTSDAFWRRLVLVPWQQEFKGRKADKKLPEVLRGEAPGILNWAIEGCLLWQGGGLAIPRAVSAAGTDFRLEVDRVGAFLAACCEPDAENWVTTQELYAAYQDFEQGEGREDEVYDGRHFRRLLLNTNLARRQVKGSWRWGVRMKAGGESE